MGKVVRNTHISGEAGVIKFADYCNRHQPYILFREVLKSDFGIDGEVELTRINEDRKIEPLGEIMKVQIKTVASDNSYIRNEKATSFEFYPRKEDIQYWEKYKKNGIEVLLVIYDQRNDALYCKKVIDADIYVGKENLKKGKKKNTNAVTFHKADNLLQPGGSDFNIKFSNSFKSRVAFGIKEYLLTNFLKYQQHPKQMYVYSAKYKNKKAIYEVITQEEAPFFVVYNSLIYTAVELGMEYTSFKSKILEEDLHKLISYAQILEDRSLRNHYIELLNEYIKYFLKTKKMAYQKEYHRFYFWLPKDQESVVVPAVTRKRGLQTERMVVKKYVYGKQTFFRHYALECKHFFSGNELYLIIQPKYYFTEDGKKALPPKAITKLTNFLTAREYNNHFCDWLHFWFSYLSANDKEIVIFEDPAYKTITSIQSKSFYTKHLRIVLADYIEFSVDFGIALDKKERKKKENADRGTGQNLLFEL
jgi:hypothetical protein